MDGLCNTSWDGSGTDRLTIAHDGSMVVHGNLDCASLITARKNIYNNLFYSSGVDHGTITDFNSITNFWL